MPKALTIESVRRLATPKVRRRIPDAHTRGLYLVIEPSGLKRWVLRYKVGTGNTGRQYTHTLGPFGEGKAGHLDLAQARAASHDWRTKIAAEQYPHVVKAREAELQEIERKALEISPTLGALADYFRDRYLRHHTKRPSARMMAFDKWLRPKLGHVKLADLKRADLNR